MSRGVRIALAAAALAAAVVAVLVLRGGDGPPVAVKPAVIPTPPGTDRPPLKDPFAYAPSRRREFERRAAAGNAHVLYAFSPGGANASAARTARWRLRIEAAARAAKVDPDELEALVFLESAGRPDARTAAGTDGAVGLTQIVAGTATQLLEMHVDTTASSRLTRRLAKARKPAVRRRLEAARRQVDERYDPVKSLAATARYLTFARDKLRTNELAFVSYHMGVGNLQSVLSRYAGGPTDEALRYAQVYFDSSPTRHAPAYAKLASLGDDSSNYLWKLMAAKTIMRLHRTDPAGLAATQRLQTAKNSAEEVLHPSATTPAFQSPDQLAAAFTAGDVVGLPVDTPRSGLRIDPRMGELAGKVGQRRSLYRGLRPEALALALYAAAQVRAAAHLPRSALTLTSTVRDERYQRALQRRNTQATRNFSLHTTGWAFDVSRTYASPQQAMAFQFVLDRLTSLNLIAWVREPAAIHVTVSADAAALRPLLDRVGG